MYAHPHPAVRPPMKLSPEQWTVLLDWARSHLRHALGGPQAWRPDAPWCDAQAATFVTLRWAAGGRLQGCIGTIEPRRALVDDVAYNVVAAALFDPRTAPIGLSQVDALDLEISVLSGLEPIVFDDEASALAALRPGVDGVVFASGGRRGLFLPQMWAQLPDRHDFMAELKMKAGCSPYAWGHDVRLWRFTVEERVDPAPGKEVPS